MTRPVLTEREHNVLRLYAEGMTNAQIGEVMYLAEETIKTYAKRINKALGANDRAHAVALGFRLGFLHLAEDAGARAEMVRLRSEQVRQQRGNVELQRMITSLKDRVDRLAVAT